MRSRIGSAQSGFSLIELLVAMVVTMIVSGAIYGLLAGGQSAFRREPELTERQQNIRSAMDMIMRDVANAGAGMPPFAQVFSRSLDATGGSPQGPDGEVTDELEILTNPGFRDNEPVCHVPGGGNSATFRLYSGTTSIPPGTPVLVIFEDNTWTMRNVMSTPVNNTKAENCQGNNNHVQLNVQQGGDPTGMNKPSGICENNGFGNSCAPPQINPSTGQPCSCTANQVSFGEVVHYRIRVAAGGVPVLERLTTAAFTAGFQAVANGIEELQVEYLQQNGSLSPPTDPDGAPAVVNNNYASLITEVRVTLSARSAQGGLQGQTSAISGPDALRGRLVSRGSPRNALIQLSKDPAGAKWK